MYLTHLTLTTGHRMRSERSAMAEDTMDAMMRWLSPIINTGQQHPLPAPLADYTALALSRQGALLVTVYGRAPQVGARMPLVTFGVVHRSRQAKTLWHMLLRPEVGPVAPGVAQPGTPWLAVHLHPTAASDVEALGWLADFERSVAWSWITRQPPDLAAVP